MTPPATHATAEFLARFSRRRMWARALLWNAIGWAAGLATYLLAGSAVLALLCLGVVVLGGFAWDVRRTVRLIARIRALRATHPDWDVEHVLSEIRSSAHGRGKP